MASTSLTGKIQLLAESQIFRRIQLKFETKVILEVLGSRRQEEIFANISRLGGGGGGGYGFAVLNLFRFNFESIQTGTLTAITA